MKGKSELSCFAAGCAVNISEEDVCISWGFKLLPKVVVFLQLSVMWAVMSGWVILSLVFFNSARLKSQRDPLVRWTEGAFCILRGQTKSNQITDSGSVVYKMTLPVLGLQMKLDDVVSAQPAAQSSSFFVTFVCRESILIIFAIWTQFLTFETCFFFFYVW